MKFILLLLTMLGPAIAQTGQAPVTTPQDKSPSRLALARMGNREALQYFACRSLTDNLFEMENLMRKSLDSIGGDFAIEIYRQLLDSDERFLPQIREMRRNPAEDALPRLPGISVLFHLSRLLPDAGIPSSPLLDHEVDPNQDFGLRAKWRTWLDAHKEEIQKLTPTADGISFDPHSCSEVYDGSAMDRRLHAIAGENAVNCALKLDKGDSTAANSCIKRSFGKKRAFFVSHTLHDTDWDVAVGLASDGRGNIYAVAFDDAGVSTSGLGSNVELFDNKHIVVVRCPKPIQFRPSQSWNGLTCLNQPGNPLLSPR